MADSRSAESTTLGQNKSKRVREFYNVMVSVVNYATCFIEQKFVFASKCGNIQCVCIYIRGCAYCNEVRVCTSTSR